MSHPHRGRSLTVQGWQNLMLAIMGVLVLAGVISGAVLLTRADAISRELSNNIQPARLAAYQMQAALRDQETSVRGYVIAADRQFLDPYIEGQRTQQDQAAVIRDNVGDRTELIADLDDVEKAAESWRTNYADPLIATVVPGKPNLVDIRTAERGKAEFDRLRSLFDVQNDHIAAVRAAGLSDLQAMRDWRDRVLGAMVVAFFVMVIVLAVLVRRAVTRPLDALAAACRRITEGSFDEQIIPQGPRDIRNIATDVENMRQRIVDELESSRSARAALAEQTEALDDQAAELRRSNAELEQFAYVASHDLQEPLRKVASFCQLLEKRYGDKLDERGIEYIGFAVDGAKRMQILINDLLTFSRVGRLNAAHDVVDLDSTLDAALSNVSASIEESGAQVLRPQEPLPTIMGDKTLLTMLWQNLVGNAVKFRHDDRPPRITIGCQPGAAEQAGQWLFTVVDNGIGIPSEFVDKVFVIFQRLHSRDSYSGTGIGLALCKKIVEYHGGTIWIDTSYTDGTLFRFTVPIAVESDSTAALEGSHI